ncbi:hypothetical protein OFB92_34440, partial [Escherichia coli]|nr:hypothetical protein [Escherichia coli]
EDQLALNPPFFVNYNFTSDTLTPALRLSTGFAADTLSPANVDVRRVQLRAANPDASTPYMQQWSLGVQRQFGRDWLAEISYV